MLGPMDLRKVTTLVSVGAMTDVDDIRLASCWMEPVPCTAFLLVKAWFGVDVWFDMNRVRGYVKSVCSLLSEKGRLWCSQCRKYHEGYVAS